MRLSGKIAAAIEILDDFDARGVPIKKALASWSRGARFAGAKDRAWISGVCLDALRRRQSIAHLMGDASGRALILGTLVLVWKIPIDEVEQAVADEQYGAGALSDPEREKLSGVFIAGMDVQEWIEPLLARGYGDQAGRLAAALATRADVDLRLNTLKATTDQSLEALKSVNGKAIPILKTAARIVSPDPSERAPVVTTIPAYSKGWVEVQDLGSQIAAAAAGNINKAQVLDYCAGGGGKTLALAALMGNTGQLFAYDIDARRLKPVAHRAKRAGVRNLQLLMPQAPEKMNDLTGKMDVVFVDAPCTGSGTWRRHPDTKWRLTQKQLARRVEEQDSVLAGAAAFVKPGGRMVYVTCSVFMEENEDRIQHFLKMFPRFSQNSTYGSIGDAGILADQDMMATLKRCETARGAIRLTPQNFGSDGFFIASMMCA